MTKPNEDNLNEDQLKNILIDVRKSYRLLYLYQRRVMDLVNWIGNHLSFSYEGGWCTFSNPTPRNGKGSLNNWAWDWLNMYLYEFHWVKNQEFRLSIIIQSDTGYFHENRLKIDHFTPADKSATRLVFCAGKQEEWAGCYNFVDNLGSELEEGCIKNEEKLLCKAYGLERFINEDSTKKLVDDFVGFCKDKGVNIEPENKIETS